MFNIGEFARFGGVSVRMLRHYDKIGLLKPTRVDPTTGYRSYSAFQLGDLNRVVALKELGFALDQIAELGEAVSVEELRGMLRLRRAQVESDLVEQQLRLDRLEARLRLIERNDDVPTHEVIVRALPAQRIVTIATPSDTFAQSTISAVLNEAFTALSGLISTSGIKTDGFPFAFFTGDESTGDLVAYAAVPVEPDATAIGEPAAVMELPAVAEAATTVHRGPLDQTYREVYGELGRWLEEHGYEHVGAGRDVFVDPFPADGLSVTEIQWPLKRPDDPTPDLLPRPVS